MTPKMVTPECQACHQDNGHHHHLQEDCRCQDDWQDQCRLSLLDGPSSPRRLANPMQTIARWPLLDILCQSSMALALITSMLCHSAWKRWWISASSLPPLQQHAPQEERVAISVIFRARVEGGCVTMVRGEEVKGTYVSGVISNEWRLTWAFFPLVINARSLMLS
jgi:hypothetical protein